LAWGLLTLGIGAVFRAATSSLVVLGGGFNLKERLFIVIAWLPKATVQAAFASVIIDHAKRQGLSEEVVGWGFDVMTLAVLSILVTAPTGAAGLMLAAPRLLTHDDDGGDDESGKNSINVDEVKHNEGGNESTVEDATV
jgi:hypothetical protein